MTQSDIFEHRFLRDCQRVIEESGLPSLQRVKLLAQVQYDFAQGKPVAQIARRLRRRIRLLKVKKD